MRLFFALTKKSFQRQMTYRAATLAGFVTNFFFGLLRAAIFIALYGQQSQVAGITLQGAITYTALSQAVIGYLSIFHWYDLMHSIHSGQIAGDLLKPMGIFGFWMPQDLGRAAMQLLLRGVLFMLVFGLFFDLVVPTSAVQWLALVYAILLSWMVSFSWRFLVNLAALWSPNAIGIGRFLFVLSWFFSGFMMPLRYFPDWLIQLAHLTPFPAMVNTVVEVYLGLLQGADLLGALLVQLLWALVLIACGQVVLRLGIRRLVILGG